MEHIRGTSWKSKLKVAVDKAIWSSLTYEEFLVKMKASGYEIREGKNLAFRAPEQKHFTNIKTLGSYYSIENVNARTLLTGKRFDLFAKLYYLTHYKENKEHALCVYIEHIKAFNPDGKEPGRDDKLSFDDFVSVFNNLIESFKDKDFDKSVSLVPVDSNGVILDGAHRVAILAYYNKEITIARFKDVTSKANFDYQYFKMRGLSWVTLDEIALEMMYWLSNVHVMCI